MVRAARQDSAKFAGCFLRILLSIEGSFKTCRMVRIRTGQTASPGGSWLREAQTDEGQKAPNICTAASIVLPDPHPALRATFPGGEGFWERTFFNTKLTRFCAIIAPKNQGADALCEEENRMFLINAAMERISIGTAALIVVLGMAVVFFGLILLMFVTQIAGKIISGRKKTEAPAAAPAAAAPVTRPAEAPGSAGQIKLHNVPDKTAAMLMAIVADKTGKPLNQLRFISIREITDGE